MEPDNRELSDLIERHRNKPGGLMPLLHAVQEVEGHIPPGLVPKIASAFKLSNAEVHGVISFYHDFRSEAPGRHIVQICRAEACQSMGARDLEWHAREALGIDYGETTPDGAITLEPVYCLGNCACSPSIRIDHRVFARVDADRFDELTALLCRDGGRS